MERETALRQQMIRIRETRQKLSLSQRAFSEYLNIPLRTIEDWEAGRRMMPDYVLRLILYKVNMDLICQKQTRSVGCDNQTESVNIVYDAEGKAIVLIDHLLFRSRRQIDWNVVEEYLKSCIGKYFEIAETAEKIYVGKDFPDEFSHSQDRKKLRGANEKAKANMPTAIEELVRIATKKTEYPDYNNKHKAKAKYGWYRYDTRFGIPVYHENGDLERYNIFSARMLVRCDADGNKYLYDFIRTKKETSRPLEQ